MRKSLPKKANVGAAAAATRSTTPTSSNTIKKGEVWRPGRSNGAATVLSKNLVAGNSNSRLARKPLVVSGSIETNSSNEVNNSNFDNKFDSNNNQTVNVAKNNDYNKFSEICDKTGDKNLVLRG